MFTLTQEKDMGDLTLHRVTSIKIEKTDKDDWYSLVKVRVEMESSYGSSNFEVNLFGDPGLSVETDVVQIFKGDDAIEIKEEVNAAE